MNELSRYTVNKTGLLFCLDWFKNVDSKYHLPSGLMFTHVNGVVCKSHEDFVDELEFTMTHMINHIGPYEPSQNEPYTEWYRKHYN